MGSCCCKPTTTRRRGRPNVSRDSETARITQEYAQVYMNAPMFSLKGRVFCDAFVTDVYDGDTITVALQICQSLGFQRFKVRLEGIDTPEIRPPKSMPNREVHILHAIEARDAVRSLILGKHVTLTAGDFDKYGRVLARVYVDKTIPDLSQWLLDEGHAVPYDGKTKKEFNF